MRVLQVVHALPPAAFGGTELYARDLSEALAAAGHDVAIATPRAEGAELDGVAVAPLPEPRRRGIQDDVGLPTGPVSPRVDERFAALLDGFSPDVVHLQHLKGLSATLPALCADRDVPCLLTLHDFWTLCHREQLARPGGRRCSGPESVAKCTDCLLASEDGPGDALEAGADPSSTGDRDPADGVRDHYADAVGLRRRQLRRALGATDELVAPSAFLRDVFVAHGIPADAVVHRRNGIAVDRFEGSGFDPDAPLRVGYAGRIVPEKGVHHLLAAFDRMDGDATLEVFGAFDPGSDEYHARLARLAGAADRHGPNHPSTDGDDPPTDGDESSPDGGESSPAGDQDRGDGGGHRAAPADDRVRFHGRYDDRTAPYRAMDVLVLPSTWYENSPLVIQEAFAAGAPVVAGDVGGMAELVTDGEDGLTVPVGDPGALAGTLSSLARDSDRMRRLRAGVRPPKRLDAHASELVDRYEARRSAAGATVAVGGP